MEVEIWPEPSPEERAALLAALEQLRVGEQDAPVQPWWREGTRENLEGGEEAGSF